MTPGGFLLHHVEGESDRCRNQAIAQVCAVCSHQRLESHLSTLREKRARILDVFLDGVISKQDRDARLGKIDRDIAMVQESLADCSPAPEVDISHLIEAFAPLVEWEYWTRDQKRSVLATIAPDIRVANYEVTALRLNPTLFSNDNTHRAMGHFVAERPLVYFPLDAGHRSAS